MKPTERHASDNGVAHDDREFLHNPEVAHEHGDINIRAVAGFLIGLTLVVAVSMVLMWGTFIGLEKMAAANDPDLSPVATPAGQLPPEPRLLLNEPQQLQQTRAAEAAVLQGGRDEQTGATRMSIDDAKKRLLEQGLPARAGAPVDGRLGTHAPAFGESSGGRVLGGAPAAPAPAAQPGAQPPAAPAAAQPHKGGH